MVPKAQWVRERSSGKVGRRDNQGAQKTFEYDTVFIIFIVWWYFNGYICHNLPKLMLNICSLLCQLYHNIPVRNKQK